MPIHYTFREPTNVTYQPFEECAIAWGQSIRHLRTGEAFAMFANAPGVHSIAVNHFPLDVSADSERRVDELLKRNYESDCFLTASDADREIEACRRLLLSPPTIVIPSLATPSPQPKSDTASDPFR